MPSWLVEDPTYVYLLLGLAAVGCAAGWWMTRRRKYLLGFAAAVVLIVLVRLADSLVVTDREKIIASVQTMADGVAARDVNGIFSHVSPRFSVAGRNKADFQQWAGDRIRAGDVTSLRVWDFAKGQVDRDKGVATIEFLVKGNGAWVRGGEFFRCKARFFLDPDGEWRLAGFELFQPYQDPALAQPLDIPHLHR